MSKPFFAALIVFFLLFSIPACSTQPEDRYPDANILSLTEAETDWYAAGITHYQLVTEIHFADERRRHTVTVKDQQILEGTVAYWNAETGTWDAPIPMDEKEAYWYSVPGLFETVRAAILKECRSYVRIELSGTPTFPRVIILGPPEEDGEIIEDVVSWVEVIEFTPLIGDEG